MIRRSFPLMVVLGLMFGGCSRHGSVSVTHPASTNPQTNRYQLANRDSDPLANYGVGTSADIPDNPALGRYPGSITPPVTPLMANGD